MSTEKKRVAGYLSKEIEAAFNHFKSTSGIEGDSEALNAILAAYFGIAKEAHAAGQIKIRDIVRHEVDLYLKESGCNPIAIPPGQCTPLPPQPSSTSL